MGRDTENKGPEHPQWPSPSKKMFCRTAPVSAVPTVLDVLQGSAQDSLKTN